MACLSRRHLFFVYPAVVLYCCALLRPVDSQLDGPQDTTYVDPNRFGSNKKREYHISENGHDFGNQRFGELLLNRFLETQDPKYFFPNLYPEKQRPDHEGVDSVRDGTPEAVRRDYIPNQELRSLLYQIDLAMSEQCTSNVDAQWNFETNVNDVTQLRALESQLIYTDLQARVKNMVSLIPRERIQDKNILRQIQFLSVIGVAALPRDQLDRYNRIVNDMLAVYNSATICAYNHPLQCGIRLEPDITTIMAKSRDWDELQHTWIEWHRRSGQKMRDLYDQMVELCNYSARLNNLTDYTEYLTFPYEAGSFRIDVEEAWNEIKPLYEQLHAYVRRKLRDLYGPEKINRHAPLPGHILGNMWAQSWSNILDITIPYPGKSFSDVTPQMVQQGYTPLSMFRHAEEFYLSMNFSGMPPDFWSNSVLEEQPDRPIICQPSAWDFCNRRDYRIKMCTHVNMKDFITVHHEMAHVQYFLQYRNQPKVFRDGANPGFHEAVSEAIALSVGSPQHLQTLGLVFTSQDDTPHNVNYLYAMALEKLPFLPFSLAMDSWRWDVFHGSVSKERYNCHWWDYRERFGGIKPPVLRSENDFDPGSKYHVPANIPYIRYFVATVLQFQLHRSLCRAAGKERHFDAATPLHKCDIYRSSSAGKLLAKLMEKGSSERWQEVLREATGEPRLDGSAIREYFAPLEEWLRNENLRTQEHIGWIYDGDYCKRSIETANLQVYGGFYNRGIIIAKPSVFIFLMCLYLIM